MKKITRVALAGVACAAVAVPAIALAANPVKGGAYSNQKILDFATVSKTGTSATLEITSKCNHGIPVEATKKAKIANGKLTYNGPAKELGGGTDVTSIVANGTFVTKQSLKWTVTVKAGSCTSKHKDTLTLMKKS